MKISNMSHLRSVKNFGEVKQHDSFRGHEGLQEEFSGMSQGI